MDYPGKVITKTAVTPTQTSATGVWTLDDAAAAVRNNNWPVAGVPNPISKSLRFNSADSAYLNRTPASTSNRTTWTWSGWIKRGALSGTYGIFGAGTDNGTNRTLFWFTSSDTLIYQEGSTNLRTTNAVFRDPSAWGHLVVVVDNGNATAANRILIYWNGVLQTTTGTGDPGSTQMNLSGVAMKIGTRTNPPTSEFFDGYMTEINFIDGQALTPSSFGMTDPQTGAWEPIRYTGTYGTNGFYLNFKDATSTTTLGYDYSGNGNNWTTNNFSVTAGSGNDSLTDVPTPWIAYNTTGDVGGVVRGNYCTANAVDLGSVAAPTNGNLAQTLSGTNGTGASGTFTVTTGKWYWEVTSNATTNAAQYVGVIRGALPSTAGPTTNPSGFYYGASGNNREDGTTVTYGNSWTNLGVDYVIGVALDCDANTVVFYVNNVSQGTRNLPSTTSGWKPQLGFNSSSGSAVMNYNFGQRPFAYTPPAGFLSLCTTNLPTPTIGATSTTQANDYFDVNLWTGNGTSQSIVNSGSMQPDFVWVKQRSSTQWHRLVDAVRGTNKILYSNDTSAEFTDSTQITAFNSNGFSVGSEAGVNANSATYVGWQWKANGTGVTNTAGSITSTVSANTTAGFSIVTYTGTGANATVGHGLGVAPSMIIVKSRNNADNWYAYHASIGNTGALNPNTTGATITNTGYWNNTSPTSTVFTIGTIPSQSTWTYVAYCFAPIAGYSAFGSYTGNGSTDGPFVYCGFRPRFVIVKNSTTAGTDWDMYDSSRSTYNQANAVLRADTSGAELSILPIDFLSNGFKIRDTGTDINASSATIIYAAFAESPFKFANAR